jgi:hypothetical protein
MKEAVRTDEQLIKPHYFQKGVDARRNLKGRPVGSEDFKTKFYRVIDKLAAKDKMTREEIEDQLLEIALKKAKNGNFNFYRDLMDRLHGKAKESIDVSQSQNIIVNIVHYGDMNKIT